MKLILDVSGSALLLNTTQAAALADLLHGCEFIEHKYTGSTKPGSGQQSQSIYVDLIKPAVMRNVLKMLVLSQTDYDAMVLITKLQGEI